MKKKILVIEDEVIIRHAIENHLQREGYDCQGYTTGEEGLQACYSQEFDLILLDIMLPKMSGEAVLKEVRKKSDVPIIIISALQDELIQMDAFEQNVDDYVVKPFSMNILMYKIAALLRRIDHNEPKVVHYQELVLEVNNFRVFYREEEIKLTPKEFEVLQVMLLNINKVFTRDELLSIVWGYDYYGDSRTIDVHIKNIRQKLYPELITTIKGIGYKVAQ